MGYGWGSGASGLWGPKRVQEKMGVPLGCPKGVHGVPWGGNGMWGACGVLMGSGGEGWVLMGCP